MQAQELAKLKLPALVEVGTKEHKNTRLFRLRMVGDRKVLERLDQLLDDGMEVELLGIEEVVHEDCPCTICKVRQVEHKLVLAFKLEPEIEVRLVN